MKISKDLKSLLVSLSLILCAATTRFSGHGNAPFSPTSIFPACFLIKLLHVSLHARLTINLGGVFGFLHHRTWEFTSSAPVRSIFPLWPVYTLPMLVLKWVWAGLGTEDVPPKITYYALRALMFILSFVLEDWAIHELVQSPRHRRLAATLVASSYVTWTYQTHTFSNSVETLAVLWTLVMIQRILENKVRTGRYTVYHEL